MKIFCNWILCHLCLFVYLSFRFILWSVFLPRKEEKIMKFGMITFFCHGELRVWDIGSKNRIPSSNLWDNKQNYDILSNTFKKKRDTKLKLTWQCIISISSHQPFVFKYHTHYLTKFDLQYHFDFVMTFTYCLLIVNTNFEFSNLHSDLNFDVLAHNFDIGKFCHSMLIFDIPYISSFFFFFLA